MNLPNKTDFTRISTEITYHAHECYCGIKYPCHDYACRNIEVAYCDKCLDMAEWGERLYKE